MNSENELLFGMMVPPRLTSKFCVRSGAFTSTNGLSPLKTLSRTRVEKPPRIGPMPACVMMSMPSLSAEWFSAGNVSRTMRIERITSRDGSVPPLKPSTRTTRVAAGHLDQLAHQLVRIVRQRVDLFGGQLRRQRSAVRIRGRRLRVAADFDGVFEPGERELDLLLVVAGAQAARRSTSTGIEAAELRGDGVAAGLESGERGHAGVAGRTPWPADRRSHLQERP